MAPDRQDRQPAAQPGRARARLGGLQRTGRLLHRPAGGVRRPGGPQPRVATRAGGRGHAPGLALHAAGPPPAPDRHRAGGPGRRQQLPAPGAPAPVGARSPAARLTWSWAPAPAPAWWWEGAWRAETRPEEAQGTS